MKKLMIRLVLATLFGFMFSSCAGFGQKLKRWMGGQPEPAAQAQAAAANSGPKFSENPYVNPGARRQYRQTKRSIAEESQLESKAGSLWVTEGQGAYLFAQNIMRMIGDPLNIMIEGEPKKQLEAKAKVINDLLKKIELQRLRRLASRAAGLPAEPESEAKGAAGAGGDGDEAELFPVKRVPTRITERLVDGNYRVKGSQPFMIGTREFKVIVTGIVRAEDFNEEGTSASKLLDPSFDIVSSRKGKDGEI